MPTAHGEPQKTLGKGFAVCYTRQTALGVHSVAKRFFAECFFIGHSTKTLPSAKTDTRQKKSNMTPRRHSWRVCRVSNSIGTRQTCLVCRVSTEKKHSANNGFCGKKTLLAPCPSPTGVVRTGGRLASNKRAPAATTTATERTGAAVS